MTVHYFTPAPDVRHRVRELVAEIRGRAFRFLTDAAVFSGRRIDRGTRLLLDVMPVQRADVVLDLGCGYGVIGLAAATLAPEGWAHLVDVNARAVDLARENARRNGVANVTVHLGDGVEPVSGVTFDLVLTNPPIRAGRAAVLRLFAGAHERLRVGGRFLFVARTAQGVKTLARYATALFGDAREVSKGGGFRVYECVKNV